MTSFLMVCNVVNTCTVDFGFHEFIFGKYPTDKGTGHKYLCSVPISLQENISVVLYLKYTVIPSFELCPDPLLMIAYSDRPSLSENVNSTPGILHVVVTGNFKVFRPNNLDY